MQTKTMNINGQEIPVFPYDKSMGQYRIPEDIESIARQHSLEQQANLFKMRVCENISGDKFMPLYAKLFRDDIIFSNLGIVVDNELIVGLKIKGFYDILYKRDDSEYLLWGHSYEETYFPIFHSNYGGQVDSTEYEIEADIVFKPD